MLLGYLYQREILLITGGLPIEVPYRHFGAWSWNVQKASSSNAHHWSTIQQSAAFPPNQTLKFLLLAALLDPHDFHFAGCNLGYLGIKITFKGVVFTIVSKLCLT